MDPFDRARPILQYVNDLENKVRLLRSREGLLDLKVFAVGVLVGLIAGFVAARLI